MALTPDEIERRTFPIADWGYDRGEVHKFLVETAAVLRYVQHAALSTAPGVVVDPAPEEVTARSRISPELAALVTEEGAIDLHKVGDQVSRILEAAETLAAGLCEDAEREAIAIRAGAEQAAADRIREAEQDARVMRDQAKRVLVTSQEQAGRITSEAEEEATALRAAAEQRVQQRTEKIQRVAQQHADRVKRFERDTVRRLEDARADLQRAIEQLTGSIDNPVLDLSRPRPSIRTGSLEETVEDGDQVVSLYLESVSPAVTTPVEPVEADTVGSDPVSNMVRAAVERAVEHSTTNRTGSSVRSS